ncbi:acyltransferase [Rickenella mellea]|uniref:Acyltransferase n=1 Tax=Rickenella mellea TaxID=50990 RepID=A0A4Y7Q229_9AGAM|nr:acyltransferase [Rickenella mellea]
MSESKVLHRVIRRIAGWAVWSFFTEVHVIGGENVPADGPIIVCATHHNMMLDPAILSSAFPRGRIMNYWTKASLFANPAVAWILHSTGNIPVDRKSKDNQGLFRGTFMALAKGEAVALFPEGTSYTEPRIMQVKDGAAWAALEYTKWARENPGKAAKKGVMIIPAGIVYTNKSKYRSQVIMEFGEPIPMTEYEDQFLSPVDGEARKAVKRLTTRIEREMIRSTINAPDWNTLYAARMARDLLWENEYSIPLDDFVAVNQTIVDLFSTPDLAPNFPAIRRHLLTYYSLLEYSKLTNSLLSSLPLPPSLDPSHPTPLPSRLYTLAILIRDTLSCAVRLPFAFVPLLLHAPAYAVARLGARLAEDEEETQAQNKVVFGLVLLLMLYPMVFFFVWALLLYTRSGALVAAGSVWLLAVYHVQIINENYEHAKRLIAAWRVLVGVWTPKKWDLSVMALTQYTTPLTPAENPWVKRPVTPTPSDPSSLAPTASTTLAHGLPANNIPIVAPTPISAPTASSSPLTLTTPNKSLTPTPTLTPTQTTTPFATKTKNWRKRLPPSRRLVRHVLRARSEAAAALASLFEYLDDPVVGQKFVYASPHLARMYNTTNGQGVVNANPGDPEATSRRAHEVISFLRARGAKISALTHRVKGDWDAVSSSDAEGDMDSFSFGDTGSGSDTPTYEKDEPVVWVPPSVKH